jgi:hypothetical protein
MQSPSERCGHESPHLSVYYSPLQSPDISQVMWFKLSFKPTVPFFFILNRQFQISVFFFLSLDNSNPDGPKPTQHLNLAQPTYPSRLPCLSHGPNRAELAQPKARARVSSQGHTAVDIFDWCSDLVQLWHECMLHQFLVQTRSLIYWVCTREYWIETPEGDYEFLLESPRQEQDSAGETTFHLSWMTYLCVDIILAYTDQAFW